MSDGNWWVALGDALLAGGDDSPVGLEEFGFGEGPFGEGPFGGEQWVDAEVKGYLSFPPQGMGVPPLRTEDVTYFRRDGVRHFNDMYEPRIITLEEVFTCGSGCVDCPTVKEKVRDLMKAWSRKCDDVELVIFTDCHGQGDRSLVGPFGVVGRPRVADLTWDGRGSSCATMTFRFDAADHRMFVLDEDGTPGSGEQCLTLTPEISFACRTYDRCYEPNGMCYTAEDMGGGPVDGTVEGDLCVNPTITLNGILSNPMIENVTSGAVIGYSGTIRAEDLPVIINTREGTATQGGQSRTHLLTGVLEWSIEPGEVVLRLTSFGASDDGTADVCWRPAVLSA